MKSKIAVLSSLLLFLTLPLCRGQTVGGQWTAADGSISMSLELQKFKNVRGVPFYVDQRTGRVLVDIGTNITIVGTVTTLTNVSAMLAGVTGTIPFSQTNAPAVKLTMSGLELAFTGDTNVPVQCTNATTLVRFITVGGYSNYLANASTIWFSYSGNGGPFWPVKTDSERNFSVPANMAVDLTNCWWRAQATNDGCKITWGQ